MLNKVRFFLLIIIIVFHFGCLRGMQSNINFNNEKSLEEYDNYIDSLYIDPDFKNMNIKRVLFLPLKSNINIPNLSEKITNICVSEFQKKGIFEIVYDQRLIKDNNFDYTIGEINKDYCIRLGKEYNVDAIIYGTILQYKPYPPFSLGLSLNMTRVWDAKTIWSAEDVKDASLKETIILSKQYFNRFVSESHPLTESRVILMSQDRYIKFVIYLFVDTFEFRKKSKNYWRKTYFK